MKKIYAAIVAILLLSSYQGFSQKGFYVGIAGNVQNTWITNQENYSLPAMDYVTTFTEGGNLNLGYDFTNSIGIKIEVGYTTLGQNYTKTRNDSVLKRNVKLNYLTIPIMFKYRVGGPILKFFFAVGPQYNMLLSANQTYTMNGETYMESIKSISGKTFIAGESSIKDRFTSSDILARIDLGIDIMLVKHLMIEFGVKLGYGLMDLNASDYRLKDKKTSEGNYTPSHDVTGGLSLGINYHL